MKIFALILLCSSRALSFMFSSNKNGIYTCRFAKNQGDVNKALGKDVNDILGAIANILEPIRAAEAQSTSDSTIEDLKRSYEALLDSVKELKLSDEEKSMVYAEASMMTKNEEEDIKKKLPDLRSDKVPSSLYSDARAPVLIVYGPGKVGQKLESIAREFGKSAEFKFVESNSLSIIQDSELKFLLRNCKTIVIAPDMEVEEKKGWFGSVDAEVDLNGINFKGLKRLLNAAVKEINNSGQGYPVKVVSLGKACKQQKSISSFLSGDNTELESEVILECRQRQLNYNIVKIGKIVDDDVDIPDKVRNRSVMKDAVVDSSLSTRNVPKTPFVISRSRVFESSESTRVSLATEALLRASMHPHPNATFSVLSTPGENRNPTEEEWQDEFLKIDGPEITRIPLLYSSVEQSSIKVRRVVRSLLEPGSGLITPIEIQEFQNGVRIIFKPRADTYTSSKEEKNMEKNEENRLKEEQEKIMKTKRKSGYLSPEAEKELENLEKGENLNSNNMKKKQKKVPLDGGLEIIVDSAPYPRVRIRRCNMGSETVVKEESEGLILKKIKNAISMLENDYKILLNSSKEKLWKTPEI